MKISALIDPSPDALIAKALVDSLGREGAHRAVDALVGEFSNVELAAIAAHWPSWARPKQLPPPGDWRSWGTLTSRGWGKTIGIAKYITAEVEAGRAGCVIMAAQNLTKTESVQVMGLIEAAPPWFKPAWEATRDQLVWPNGARAFAFTPEVPDAIRSPNAHLCWLSEVQSWPSATREEAFSNFLFATRVGYAKTLWDATPKRAHPILKRLLARSEADPGKHVVVRGAIYENPHLAREIVADLEAEYGGTQKGREELLGEMLDESENALFREAWFRREVAPAIARRVIGIDPAITKRAGNDSTGIIDAGLGVDGRGYVFGDYSGKHEPSAWGAIVLDLYAKNGADLVVVETNKGGDLVVQNLRACAGSRGLRVVVLGKDDPVPMRVAGVVYVREVHARGAKEDRAQPVSTAYERGRVVHVKGADLQKLEDVMTSWEPSAGGRSPDALDALVHAITELLGLLANRPDHHAGFVGLAEIAKAASTPGAPTSISTLLGLGRSTGGRF